MRSLRSLWIFAFLLFGFLKVFFSHLICTQSLFFMSQFRHIRSGASEAFQRAVPFFHLVLCLITPSSMIVDLRKGWVKRIFKPPFLACKDYWVSGKAALSQWWKSKSLGGMTGPLGKVLSAEEIFWISCKETSILIPFSSSLFPLSPSVEEPITD